MSIPTPTGSTNDIKAVIFDLGGVIVRTDQPAARTQLAASLGKTYAELDKIVFGSLLAQQAEEGLVRPDAVWEAICQTLGLPIDEADAFRLAFFGGDVVDFELVHLIRQLGERYTTAALSNTWLTDLERYLVEDMQVPADTFDVIISSAAVGIAKPKPAVFELALQRCGAAPHQAVFVDDNEDNIKAARALGMHTVHFRSTQQARAELLALVQLPESRQ